MNLVQTLSPFPTSVMFIFGVCWSKKNPIIREARAVVGVQ